MPGGDILGLVESPMNHASPAEIGVVSRQTGILDLQLVQISTV